MWAPCALGRSTEVAPRCRHGSLIGARGRPVLWVGPPGLRRAAARTTSWAPRALGGSAGVAPRCRHCSHT
eukprot:9060050-Pyramimonas_sp.AAC.1